MPDTEARLEAEIDVLERQIDDLTHELVLARTVYNAGRDFTMAWADPSDRSPWVAKHDAFLAAIDAYRNEYDRG